MFKNIIFLMFCDATHAVRALLFLIFVQQFLEAVGNCPENFTSIDKYCCYLKPPEKFLEKYTECPGNLYTFNMYKDLMIKHLPDPGGPIWTDYTSLFSGMMPLIDWSYSNTTLTPIDTINITRPSHVGIHSIVCLVYDPINNLTMVECHKDSHYRYCVVEAASTTTQKYKKLKLSLVVERNPRKIKLKIDYMSLRKDNDSVIDSKNIKCFTYSSSYTIQKVELLSDFYLKSADDGYYWCTHSGSKNFDVKQSDVLTYIKDPHDTFNKYAVKIKYSTPYTLDEMEIEELLKKWAKTLRDYLHYTNEYGKTVKEDNYNISSLKNFRMEHQSNVSRYIFQDNNIKVKRLYIDYTTVLLHVKLYPGVKPVKPGDWMDLLVVSMKPVYYCDTETEFHSKENRRVSCALEKCIGDYFNGVEIVTDRDEKCSAPPKKEPPKKNELQNVIIEMENIVNNSNPITANVFSGVFSRADDIISSEVADINGHFLKLLDGLCMKINLNGLREFKKAGRSIAVLVAEASPQAKVMGFRIVDRNYDEFNRDAFKIIDTEINNSTMRSENKILIYLPLSVSSIKRRIVFLIFRQNGPFKKTCSKYEINSMVIGVQVENLTSFLPGERFEIHMKPSEQKQKRRKRRTCAFWKMHEDGTGNWSQEGCNFTRASEIDQLDICRCNHLTHFAEILVPRTTFSTIHEEVLEIISIIGGCFSIIGLLFVVLTAVILHPWRRDFGNKIWLQLSISILILCICFLTNVFVQFEEDDYFCPLTGILLHYAVLSSFCWMLVAAVISYRKLVVVLSPDPTHKLLRACAFAWGVPFIVVCVVLSVDPHSYAGLYEEKSSIGAFCYPSGLTLWLAVYVPIGLMLLTNLTLFVLIVRSVFGKHRPIYQRRTDLKETFRRAFVSCLLVFIFGLPWVFGLLSYNIVFSYLFTIFVIFQGLVLVFVFVGNKKTRDLWLVKLKIKKKSNNTCTTSTEAGQAMMNINETANN